MTNIEDRLSRLGSGTLAEPGPLEPVERRATQLRRRRRTFEAVAGTAAVVAVVLAGMSLAARTTPEAPDVVFEEPPAPLPEGWTRTELGALTVAHPKGWHVELSKFEDSPEPEVVLSNRPLSKRDTALALLARGDAKFSNEFPADAVVFVVGGDYLDMSLIEDDDLDGAPGPAMANTLGKARTLPRPDGYAEDIVVRRGFVEQSTLRLAGYIGPDAPRRASKVLDDVAARLRLREVALTREDMEPPGPDDRPFGSNGVQADDPIFTEPWPVQLQVRIDAESRYAVRTKGDCVALTNENDDGRNLYIMARKCGLAAEVSRPIEVITGGTVRALPPPPGSTEQEPDVHHLLARVQSGVASVTAELIDGRTHDAKVHNGWAVVMAPGRILRLVAFDADGKQIGIANDL